MSQKPQIKYGITQQFILNISTHQKQAQSTMYTVKQSKAFKSVYCWNKACRFFQ